MCRFWLKFAAGSVVGRMAAVCKQLEAAQSFLRQVAALPNFAALREKQHAALLALVKKTLYPKRPKIFVSKILRILESSQYVEEGAYSKYVYV